MSALVLGAAIKQGTVPMFASFPFGGARPLGPAAVMTLSFGRRQCIVMSRLGGLVLTTPSLLLSLAPFLITLLPAVILRLLAFPLCVIITISPPLATVQNRRDVAELAAPDV